VTILQCMGGWCRQRDKCRHYTAPAVHGIQPVERLCGEIPEPELFDAQARRIERYRAAVAAMVASGETTPWARHWASMPPLGRPLTDGEPVPAGLEMMP
jgi:hypothetical protein